MPLLSVARCAGCHAVVNPNWPACLVCERKVSASPPMDVHSREETTPLPELAAAYQRYWALSETDVRNRALEAKLRGDITRLEVQWDPAVSWMTLRTSATAYHLETNGICPFCRQRGDLHLPAAQRELELTEGRL